MKHAESHAVAPASKPAAASNRADSVAAPGPCIELRGASVRFGRKLALCGADVRVQAGERIALVGANGSGKSTLLRALHGLVPLAEGSRDVAPGLQLAMVFQRPFMLRLSARANVELALFFAGVARAERRERAEAALRRVGLDGEARRSGRVLSGGQQQRLALARAWALQPDVLLLDEPTASLDPTAKREVEALVEEFTHAGMTLVMSSHNLGQVKRLAGRVIYLEQGRLLCDVDTGRFFHGELPREAELFLRGELPWR
ncbi:ATP-binding cassette domain-containing protein [Schlegelella sp. S2-27]|uniref:ATP-binding cassette domain-containing protein n=1 Tax=Caldimonas mangrovi TaxID=2944811 RepID=A0ABT0YMF8_9BURK|nr:ATP-binding cassette domain-containing protein [Caldimonas mangrovi]MCM5679549.1 ATP-binding cassette domain-containing protein [Caldimonas mangrovi]